MAMQTPETMYQSTMLLNGMHPQHAPCEHGMHKRRSYGQTGVCTAYSNTVTVTLSVHHALSPFPASRLKWLLDHLLSFLVGLNTSSNRQCHCAAGTAFWIYPRRMLW
jgi:hypothetical protein